MTHLILCRCPECKDGDALPEHLQGIPGAQQLTFVAGPVMTKDAPDEIEEFEPLDPDAVVRPLL